MAVMVTIAQIKTATRDTQMTDAQATDLLTLVAALVENYAVDAPEAVQNEAALRAAGWWWNSPEGPLAKEDAGPLSSTWALSRLNPIHHSGASMILSPFRTNTMGVV